MKKEFLKRAGLLNLGSGFGMAVLLLGLSFSGCEQGCGFGDEPQPDPLLCNTEVTVETAGCASGVFQSRWFKRGGMRVVTIENI